MIDLHTHSSASDGNLSPSNLISYATEKNVSVLALCDHDTIQGIQEAKEEAQKKDITFISGIELNIQWPTGEFHLLGLGLQNFSEELLAVTKKLQEERNLRNSSIAEKMKNDGLAIDFAEIKAKNPSGCIGRPHFAEYLVEKKLVKTRQQAFDKYLGKGRPYYVERTGADLKEAIFAIKTSGGIPVLAHPLSLYVSWGKITGVLTELYAQGVQGIEAWHPGARVGECKRLESLGKELGFFVTAGSDFHGEKIRSDRKIGHTAGLTKIEDRFFYEELQPFLNK